MESLSKVGNGIVGSEIIKISQQIKEIAKTKPVANLTIGDFDSKKWPIPQKLKNLIVKYYDDDYTNYPNSQGELVLREAVSNYLKKQYKLDYSPNEILIGGGVRPLIYTVYKGTVNPNESVIYPVPSWNNNHYTHFVEGEHVVIETTEETHFMPTAAAIRPHIKNASLLSLCSPQNPTGTTFRKEELAAICDLVLEENNRRGPQEKKLYVMYDQMYWHLTYGSIQHHDPVSLRPAMKDYTIFIDAISKVFAATGLRVGWSMGPAPLIQKMKLILTHMGAWAPMAEQKGLAGFLKNSTAIDQYLEHFKSALETRLKSIYQGFQQMKAAGLPVDCITPEAAIYLTVKVDLQGKKTATGAVLETQSAVTSYLLEEASLALVPFYAFGAPTHSPWYRLSVGTCKMEEIPVFLKKLEQAIQKLH